LNTKPKPIKQVSQFLKGKFSMATSLRITLVRFHKLIVALVSGTAVVVLASQIHLAGQFLITPGGVHDVSEIVELASPHSGNPKNLNLVTVKSVAEPSLLQTALDVILNHGELSSIPQTPGYSHAASHLSSDNGMQSSFFSAAYVAMSMAGLDTPAPYGVMITDISSESNLVGLFEPGFVITHIDHQPTSSLGDVRDVIRASALGESVTIRATDLSQHPVTVEVALLEGENGNPIIGIAASQHYNEADFPVQLDVSVNNVGGPSSGLALALFMLDEFTAGSLTNDLKVVATGTVDSSGTVGPIGSLDHKSFAVELSGADVFFVPADQYEIAAQALNGSYTKVIPVNTVRDAVIALAELGGDISEVNPLTLAKGESVGFVTNSDGMITGYSGVDGEFQDVIETGAAALPTPLLPALDAVTIVNGCNPWVTAGNRLPHSAARIIGYDPACALGTFDANGWDDDNTYGHEWANTVWISSDAVLGGKLTDVLIHEMGHVINHHYFATCTPPGYTTNMADYFAERFGHYQPPASEVLADVFVYAYGDPDGNHAHTYYLDRYDIDVSDDDIRSVRSAVWLCVNLDRDAYIDGERGIQADLDKLTAVQGINELGLVSKPNLSHHLASSFAQPESAHKARSCLVTTQQFLITETCMQH